MNFINQIGKRIIKEIIFKFILSIMLGDKTKKNTFKRAIKFPNRKKLFLLSTSPFTKSRLLPVFVLF